MLQRGQVQRTPESLGPWGGGCISIVLISNLAELWAS